MTPTLSAYLESLGREYAPFDPLRMPRIYEALKKPCDFECAFGSKSSPGRVKIIHIIGTNGKGSTGRFITMGLEQNKKRVLHFTSPHLFDFAERFYINGRVVDSDMLERAHRELYGYEVAREASYFEYATLLACALARECEFLVLEAGLGGEFDSTNALWANVSVFTPIGLDHQELLGGTIEEIASTKLRAMKSIALLGRQEESVRTQIEALAQDIASQRGAKCILWEHEVDIQADSEMDSQVDLKVDFKVDSEISESSPNSHHAALEAYVLKYALPPFLKDNLRLAQKVLALFGMDFDFTSLEGLSLRGRCEIIAPNIILDVGHNLPAARTLKAYCISELGLRQGSCPRLNLVYNSYVEKDIEAILREFLPIIKKVLILSVENFRICPRQRLIETLEGLGLAYEDFEPHALSSDEYYLVFGSFSVASEFLQQYKEKDAK